ncbi:MAG: ATP-binding protein, partial [Nitrospirota bacterium]
MRDPFTLQVAKGEKFCDRDKEKAELLDHIRNGHHVVLSAKRRMGKSSLVEQVFSEIEKEGVLVVYADLFSITSENDFVSILAASIIKGIGKGAADARSFQAKVGALFTRIVPGLDLKPDGAKIEVRLDKSVGSDLLLGDVMDGLYKYVNRKRQRIAVCLDEFQEITVLKESKKIEGSLRSRIQFGENVSFLFVGSRRRILKDMFNNKNKPFYKMAYPMDVAEIPREEFVDHIVERFRSTEKICPTSVAGLIYDSVAGHTYYVQKLASLSWSGSERTCDESVVRAAYRNLLRMEAATELEGVWRGLSLGQKGLMKALAKEPTKSPYSLEFSTTHGLAPGTIRRAINALLDEDLVEISAEGRYELT